MEKWKDVNGFESVYQISNLGRVKSLGRIVMRSNGSPMSLKEKILKTCLNQNGYEHAVVQNGARTKHLSVHRLVALAFIPNPFNKPHVNHIDGCKTNNQAENLEWVTRSENEKHAHKIGLKDWRGENASNSKLVKNQVFEIRENKNSLSQRELAKKYGVSRSAIRSIISYRTWAHL